MKRGFSALPVEEWPERDRTLWAVARQNGGYWDDDGLAAHWRPATIVTAECHYGTFLWWLKREGRLTPDFAPVDRATQDNIKDVIQDYSTDHAASSVGAVLRVVANIIRVTAPAADVQWVYRLARRIKRQATPVKPPNHRMQPAFELVTIANALMERELARRAPLSRGDPLSRRAHDPCRNMPSLAAKELRRALPRTHPSQGRDTLPRLASGKRDEEPSRPGGWYPDWLTQGFDLYIQQVRPILRGQRKESDEG
jgi:hypothetical protein